MNRLGFSHIAVIRQLRRVILRTRFGRRTFSIVTNNCWGAHVYQELGLAYQTPFVGMFISPTSYLRLLSRLRHYLQTPLAFLPTSTEDWINEARQRHSHRWPIGTLSDGVELQFMHYRSEEEAREKWQRRLLRFSGNDSELFVKFCDRDGATPVQMKVFDLMPWANKVFFTTQGDCPARCAVRIPLKEPCVPDGLALSRLSPAYFDAADWLNGGSGRITCWTRWLNCV
jgi:uncharacterized protein (DUF1919 family)